MVIIIQTIFRTCTIVKIIRTQRLQLSLARKMVTVPAYTLTVLTPNDLAYFAMSTLLKRVFMLEGLLSVLQLPPGRIEADRPRKHRRYPLPSPRLSPSPVPAAQLKQDLRCRHFFGLPRSNEHESRCYSHLPMCFLVFIVLWQAFIPMLRVQSQKSSQSLNQYANFHANVSICLVLLSVSFSYVP